MNKQPENLDSMDDAELGYVANHPIDYEQIEMRRIQYARSLLLAREHRRAGRIASALLYEKKCDEIYQMIPMRARW